MANIGFNRSQGNKMRVRIEVTEPNREDEKWEISVIATVLDENGPIADTEVQFYHDSRSIDSPISTDGEGRATKNFVDLKKGNHTFEASLPGTTLKARTSVKLKEDKPKKAAFLVVNKRLKEGVLELICEVFNEEGNPVKKVGVMILSTGEQSTTDDNGMAIITPKIKFGEGENRKVIEIIVLGTMVSRKINFFRKGDSNVCS